jgi:ornithine cyclodeaminase/alanine dehydrogenase-like protein (mu-crystallin family)
LIVERRLKHAHLCLQQIALRNSGRYVGVSTGMPIEDIIFGSLVRSRVIA